MGPMIEVENANFPARAVQHEHARQHARRGLVAIRINYPWQPPMTRLHLRTPGGPHAPNVW
ncbi:MAG: hypothetical protein R3E85_07540 [Planctomycetota bacterium]